MARARAFSGWVFQPKCLFDLALSFHLQVRILFVWERHRRGLGHLLVVLVKEILVDLNFRRGKCGRSNELQLRVANQLPRQPQEGLFKVIVGLCRDVVVLKVLLSMEGNRLGLDFALLDINFVAAENYRDVFADADQITWEQLAMSTAVPGEEPHGANWGRSCR